MRVELRLRGAAKRLVAVVFEEFEVVGRRLGDDCPRGRSRRDCCDRSHRASEAGRVHGRVVAESRRATIDLVSEPPGLPRRGRGLLLRSCRSERHLPARSISPRRRSAHHASMIVSRDGSVSTDRSIVVVVSCWWSRRPATERRLPSLNGHSASSNRSPGTRSTSMTGLQHGSGGISPHRSVGWFRRSVPRRSGRSTSGRSTGSTWRRCCSPSWGRTPLRWCSSSTRCT